MVLGLTVSIILAGPITGRIGYFTPAMVVSTVLTSIGTGLIVKWMIGHNLMAEMMVYQAIYGFGCGFGWQAPYLAAQTAVATRDLTQGLVLVSFSFSTAGVVALAIAQQIFSNQLVALLRDIFPGLTTEDVVTQGATSIISQADEDELPQVLDSYNSAIWAVFIMALVLSCVSVVPLLLIKPRSTKETDSQSETKSDAV